MAVGLKEAPRADTIGGVPGLIREMRGANGDENFWRSGFSIAGIGFAEGDDSRNFRHGGTKLFGPLAHGGATGFAVAADVQQQLRVIGVGEELDLAYSLRNLAGPSAPPERGDAAVDQRRADGTFFDRQQLVRGQLKIPCGE